MPNILLEDLLRANTQPAIVTESEDTCEFNIIHMMDCIRDVVAMIDRASNIDDKILEKAVRVMYDGAQDAANRLDQIEKD